MNKSDAFSSLKSTVIKVENLHKYYATQHVLKGVSHVFADNKVHVLLGPSGSGKSTLLRILLGLETLGTGFVSVDGQSIDGLAPILYRELISKIGYVHQEGGLYPHMTAQENIELPTRLKKWPLQNRQMRVRDLLNIVPIDPNVLKKYPFQLSGGQKRMVALMRALVLNPPYLFMDEPLSALDPITHASLLDELDLVFGKLKKTVILVTHNLAVAARLADEVVIMGEGQVQQVGEFSQIGKSPANDFVKQFFMAQRPPEKFRDLF